MAMKKRIICVVLVCIMAITMLPVSVSAASQSGSVAGISYTVSCNPKTFTWKSKAYTYVTSAATFSRNKPENIPVWFGLISKDVIATANSSGFMEASTGNYCCSTGKVVYKEVTTIWGGTTGATIVGFKKNGKTYTKKYSLSSEKNANGMSQNKVSDAYLKFPKVIQKNGVIYAAKSGSMIIQWKKYSRTKTKHKNNCNITLSSTYGVGTLKLNPNVSTSGCSISISHTTNVGGLVKTHAYKK